MDPKELLSKGSIYMDSRYNFYYPEGATLVDTLPEDLAEVTPDIWKNFPPQHPLIVHFTGLILFIFWVISAVGNGMVMYIFTTTKSLRTPTNMLVVNLAFSDLCMMTTMGLSVSINVVVSDTWIWGAFMCKLYGSVGACFGTCSLITMVVIGYERYNVIVKGMKGKKMTPCMATSLIIGIWVYCIVSCIPPFLGWGGYCLDGLLITCNYDYYATDWNRRSFNIYACITHYFLPLILVSYFYFFIVKAVISHEKTLRVQAKKMNVDSLRQKDAGAESAEIRVAKVAITNVMLWALIWSPFAVVSMIAIGGGHQFITPLVSQLPCFFAKIASCLNPLIFAMSHPKYREALAERVPCLGIREAKTIDPDQTQMVSMPSVEA